MPKRMIETHKLAITLEPINYVLKLKLNIFLRNDWCTNRVCFALEALNDKLLLNAVLLNEVTLKIKLN